VGQGFEAIGQDTTEALREKGSQSAAVSVIAQTALVLAVNVHLTLLRLNF
jgi:hypothetical protein